MGMTDLQGGTDAKKGKWENPGGWFWAVIFAGFAIRLYLAIFTEGTYDVILWQQHVEGISKLGLIGYYHATIDMNHPPFIGILVYWLWLISQVFGFKFCILLRASFALLDFGSVLLLLQLFGNSRYRFLIGVCYWLHPLALIFSAYHGNTDSSIAFFLLLCVWLLSKDKMIWAAAVMGVSLWVKLPGVIAMPAIIFFLKGWRKRLVFVIVTGLAGISTYIPWIIEDPAIVLKNVFGYRGLVILFGQGNLVWGIHIFIIDFIRNLSPHWQVMLSQPVTFMIARSWQISLLLVVVFCWLRRGEKTTRGLCATIGASYAILCGSSFSWSFQYFAWSLPFWFFLTPVFLSAATILAGGYVYSVYWLFCGNPWLMGPWDFNRSPHWPAVVIIFRDLAVLFFFISGCVFLGSAIYKQVFHKHKPMKSTNDNPQNLPDYPAN
jgi:hypothetical protein